LPDIDRAIWQRWQPPTGEHVNAKVLFLDIDETMIHCIDDRDPVSMRGETKLRIGLNTEQPNQRTQYIDVDINVRPGLHECLQELKKSYQIVSFTASD